MKKALLISAIILLLFTSQSCSKRLKGTVVCIGNSLTVCGGENGRYTDYLAKWLPNATIVNKGINGNTLADGRKRFQTDVLTFKPDVVVIELGTNDFWQMTRTIEELQADLEYMVKLSKDYGAQVVIASCFGDINNRHEKEVEFGKSRIEFAKAIALMEHRVVEKYNCFYVPNMQIDIIPNTTFPYWDDKNHPSKFGNEFVAKRILTELKKALRKSKK